ncbi:hypothetical protein [Streptomyces sp. TR02-1]|uniref:hypothetical protein n=1 Tax=Streptomyces sp. TR02-1 TaxID=3385977 RepID=UPI0039A11EA8
MAEVCVRVETQMAGVGMPVGSVVRVERTSFVSALLASGNLSEAPEEECPPHS